MKTFIRHLMVPVLLSALILPNPAFAAGEWHYDSYDPKTFTLELTQTTMVYNEWQGNQQPISSLAPQVLTGVKVRSNRGMGAGIWFQVETWLGDKWIYAVRPIERYSRWAEKIHNVDGKPATVEVVTPTSLYDAPFSDTDSVSAITPQTVQVVDAGNYMYKINTWLGEQWIPAGTTNYPLDDDHGKVQNPNDNRLVTIDQTINLKYTTVLRKDPTNFGTQNLGALGPQTVRVFEKKGNWYHLHTTWVGDAWFYDAEAGDPNFQAGWVEGQIDTRGGGIGAQVPFNVQFGAGKSPAKNDGSNLVYKVGDPIDFRFSIESLSDNPIYLRNALDFHLEIEDQNSQKVVWSGKTPAHDPALFQSWKKFDQHYFFWDRLDNNGNPVPPGTYTARVVDPVIILHSNEQYSTFQEQRVNVTSLNRGGVNFKIEGN